MGARGDGGRGREPSTSRATIERRAAEDRRAHGIRNRGPARSINLLDPNARARGARRCGLQERSGMSKGAALKVRLWIAIGSLALFGAVFAAPAMSKGKHVFTVCKHGCRYASIQKAVNNVKKGRNSVVKVKSGVYHEG